MAQYQAGPPAQPATYPGKTLGIVGLVLAIFCNLIGLVISIIAYNQSKAVGIKNNIALAGIVVGAVFLVLSILGYATGFTQQLTNR